MQKGAGELFRSSLHQKEELGKARGICGQVLNARMGGCSSQ
jgi:hypothetical protein